jgi:hypothetical protein
MPEWDMNHEDYSHRCRRVSMIQGLHMNHASVSALFAAEEEAEQEKRQQRRRQVQEAKINQLSQAEVNDKKLQVLTEIEESLHTSAIPQSFFKEISESNEEATIVVIASYRDSNWTLKPILMPRFYDTKKVRSVRLEES